MLCGKTKSERAEILVDDNRRLNQDSLQISTLALVLALE